MSAEDQCDCGHDRMLHFEEFGGRCGGGVMSDIGSGELVEERCGCRRFREPAEDRRAARSLRRAGR